MGSRTEDRLAVYALIVVLVLFTSPLARATVSVPDFPFSAKPNWQIEPVRDIGLAVRGSHIITQQSPNIEIVGTFHIIWADAGAGSSVVSLPIYLLHEEGYGQDICAEVRLEFSADS